MKKYIYGIATVCAVVSGLMFLGSCSAEDDYYSEELVLDINDQIGRKRSMSGESIYQNPYQGKDEEVKIPEFEDECALFALTLLHATNKNWGATNNEDADLYYYQRRKEAEKLGYEGGAMDASIMYEIGVKNELFTDQVSFSSSGAVAQYLTINKAYVKIVNLKNFNGNNNHSGVFIDYKGDEVIFRDNKGNHPTKLDNISSFFVKY